MSTDLDQPAAGDAPSSHAPESAVLAVLADEVGSCRDDQDRRLTSLEARSGVMLGFVGAMAALSARIPGGWAQAALVCLVLAAMAAVVALVPVKIANDLNPDLLRQNYASRTADDTRWTATKNRAATWTQLEVLAKRKGRFLTAAAGLVALATIALLIASVTNQSTYDSSPAPTPKASVGTGVNP